MGIELTYKPDRELEEDVKTMIMEETARLAASESWWAEPLLFLETPSLGFLGMTKVFLHSYSTDNGYVEVKRADNFLMAWQDCQTIANILAAWSKRFGVGWQLSLDGELMGVIDHSGTLSTKLQSKLDELRHLSDFTETGDALERLIHQIDMKYASRCE